MTEGYIAFVLHFHLPWVLGHGKWPHGEDWLNEAAGECYLPLLRGLTRLSEHGAKDCLTLGITPVLTEQLSSPAFRKEFVIYVDRKIEAASNDERQFTREGQSEMVSLADMWRTFFDGIKKYYLEDLDGDIVGTFRSLQEKGVIEIITSAATHGYLPLLTEDGAITGQVRTGVENYKRRYGTAPRGFWLPECAYRPMMDNWIGAAGGKEPRRRSGIEKYLHDAGIEYTLVDTHMIKRGAWQGTSNWTPNWMTTSGDPFRKTPDGLPPPFPRRGIPPPYENGRTPYRPYEVVSQGDGSAAGTCVFVRDPLTSMQVWSGTYGYPGDGRYLEFHKKHWPGGHRYWRVTDPKADLGDKEIYSPDRALDVMNSHADHFVGRVREVVAAAVGETDAPPVVVCPFDAELFGHWWFEGPRWLEAVLDKFTADPEIKPVTLGSYLDRYPPSMRLSLPEGSWGDGGDYRVWLNDDTTWTWERVYEIERLIKGLARRSSSGNTDLNRVIEQAARELMLLEASDWQFLITTGTARDYAEQRLSNHYSDAKKLADIAEAIIDTGQMSDLDRAELEAIEKRDYCFRVISPEWWK